MVNKLNNFLANLTVLSKKVQNYHWNIVGNGFFVIHAKLDEMYEQLNEDVDAVAERVLTIGGRPLSNLKSCLATASIKEAENEEIDIKNALQNIQDDLAVLVKQVKELKKDLDETDDYATSALLDEFLISKEKLLWMLKSYTK